MSKARKIMMPVVWVAVLATVGVMLYRGVKDPVVLVRANDIQIKGMYGLSVDFSGIAGISLIEKSMSDIGPGKRTNGYGGFGQSLKGHFKSDELGETLLFVQSKSSPTIQIMRTDGKDIFLSFRSGEDTENLYREISAAIPAK